MTMARGLLIHCLSTFSHTAFPFLPVLNWVDLYRICEAVEIEDLEARNIHLFQANHSGVRVA